MSTLNFSPSLALLLNNWRSLSDLSQMDANDQRNTLIVELNKNLNATIPQLQGMNDTDIACLGVMYYLLIQWGCTPQFLKTNTPDQMRNATIVTISRSQNLPIARLQGMDNGALINQFLVPHN
jgi:hypothetical protein